MDSNTRHAAGVCCKHQRRPVRLGERAKDLEAEIQGGVGEATIRLPKNVGVVATVHGGLGSIDTHGLKEEDGQYVNEAYGKSPTTIHLSVNGGIGSIKLQQQ